MTYEEIKPLLQRGKIGLLPHYKGYFHWRWGLNKLYMKNGDDIIWEEQLDNEKKRNDWYYII